MPSTWALDPHKTLTQYVHRIWGQEEGLFQPTVYSILQTRDGFLWLGTQDSLIRFDGSHFREFDNGETAALHHSLIRTLLEDQSGNLWAGSVGSGLARITPGGVLKRYTSADGLPSDDVFCLDSEAKDNLWVCTNRGLAQFDGRRFRTFTTSDGLPTNSIRDSCRASDGTRWVTGRDSGLARWNGSGFESYSNSMLPSGTAVIALHCSSSGGVWVGTGGGLMLLGKGDARSLTTREGLPDDAVLSLAEGRDGSLWIGTNDGISRYRDGRISVYRTRDGLSHSAVLSLYEDREGTLWAGTKDGLDQFTDGKVTPYTSNEGLSSNETGPVLEDADGRLWIGTLGRGLNLYDGNRFRSLTTADGLVDNTILSLAVDHAGDLWVGTSKGLNRLTNGRVTGTFTRRDGLSGSEIRTLFSDAQGLVWAGTDRGLDHWNGRSFENSNIVPQSEGNGIVALAGGHSIKLFVSTETSDIYTIGPGAIKNFRTDVARPVDCYYLDPVQHQAWMGTLGAGLLRWKGGTFNRVRIKDGLYDNRIYSIVRDDQANFWLASSKGIFRVSQKELDDFADGKTKSVSSLPFSTGQLRFECQPSVQPAAVRTHDGRLWFSTTNGLVVIDPNHLVSNTVPPPARITATLINGQRIPWAAGQLRLKPSERNIEIRYAGLSFISPEKVVFRYMLEGYEKAWTDAGNRHEAFFTNLPPGDFRFLVSARNADGIWSPQPASLDFSIQPRLYQHAWFFPAVTVACALLGIVVYRMRIRHLRETFELVLSERSRIARELHDTLLQGLSGITMQLQALWTRLPHSEEKQVLHSIIEDAGKCSKEARRSLWGLRAVGSGSLEFSDKISRVARDATAQTSMALKLQLAPVSLRAFPEIEYQLLRITQEVIANSVLHAGAASLRIQLSLAGNELRLVFEDDGIGFCLETQPAPFGHFGLIGMRERADEIDATLVVTSAPGTGTTVAISVPLVIERPPESTAEAPLAHHMN